MGRLAVIVPLREDAHRATRELLRRGLPFDLGSGSVERYRAFLSVREAILVLEGPEVGRDDGHRWQDIATWRDAQNWERCAQSPPHLAESIHSWERAPDLEGVFFAPWPGPGDSDGGDVGRA
jgi:hypothetical protein